MFKIEEWQLALAYMCTVYVGWLMYTVRVQCELASLFINFWIIKEDEDRMPNDQSIIS